MNRNASTQIRIQHVDTEDGCEVIVDVPMPEMAAFELKQAPTTPSNDELIATIIKTYLRSTYEQRVELWNTWTNIPWKDRKAALVGGDADYGGLDGAFTLDVPDVSSNAYTYIGASLAVLARDSRSESGPFTPAHYEVLTRPWRQVFGAVHPDDDLPIGKAARR